jgi:hypothetical protein
MALALLTRSPIETVSEIKGTLYGIEGVALGCLEGRRPWVIEAGTSGIGEEDLRFPTLVDVMVHGSSTEVAKMLLYGIKECSKEEL